MTNELKCWCQHCDHELPPSHTGACPNCGQSGKRCVATANLIIGLKVTTSAERTRVHYEWVRKPIPAIIGTIVLDTLISGTLTLIGLVLHGLLGAMIALFIGIGISAILNIFFYSKVKTLIRNIEHIS